MTQVPVLEVGGTHVSAALVASGTWTVSSATRVPLDADASADALIARFVAAARSLAAPTGVRWGVAMPDPFDYAAGVARFDAAVAKFGALNGVDVGAALRSALSADVVFVNDADAFALGEWTGGAGLGATRLAAITLGTGVGSGWVVDGRVVDPGRPPGGRIHRVVVDGRPLEEAVSRRAIRQAYAAGGRAVAGGAVSGGAVPADTVAGRVAAGGGDVVSAAVADVREIAEAARAGEHRAAEVLAAAFTALGRAVAPVVAAFAADRVVIGGSMAASWDLFEPWFRAGAQSSDHTVRPLPEIRVSTDAERSGFVGAAVHASSPDLRLVLPQRGESDRFGALR